MDKKNSKKKTSSLDVKEIIKGVIAELKPELNKKIESLRSDINADVTERLSKIQVPAPNVAAAAPGTAAPGMNMQDIMKSISGKDGNIDMSAITKMMGGMQQQVPPGVDMTKFSPEDQMKMMQSQQQNQMMMMVLPELLKSNQGSSPMMAEMMQRFFMENMLDGMNQRKAFTSFAMKLAGDPKLMASYQAQQANVSTPIIDGLSTVLQKTPIGTDPNAK